MYILDKGQGIVLKFRRHEFCCLLFSWSGQSPGRAIELPPASALASASALAKSLTLKFFM